MKPLLRKKGVTWNKLSIPEQKEISKQMPKLINDKNKFVYRYYFSTNFNSWVITNAMSIPMSTNSMKGIVYE